MDDINLMDTSLLQKFLECQRLLLEMQKELLLMLSKPPMIIHKEK